jgi:hypothetical protein
MKRPLHDILLSAEEPLNRVLGLAAALRRLGSSDTAPPAAAVYAVASSLEEAADNVREEWDCALRAMKEDGPCHSSS